MIRTTFRFTVRGTTVAEIHEEIKKRAAALLDADVEDIDRMAHIEVDIDEALVARDSAGAVTVTYVEYEGSVVGRLK